MKIKYSKKKKQTNKQTNKQTKNKQKTQPIKFADGYLYFVYGYFSFEKYYSTTSE